MITNIDLEINRYHIFDHLKQLVEDSEKVFRDRSLNPFQILISILYVEIVKLSQGYSTSEHISLISRIKLKFKHILQFICYNIQIRDKKRYNYLFLLTEETHLIQLLPLWDRLLELNESVIIYTTKNSLIDRIQLNKSLKVYLIPRKSQVFKWPLKNRLQSEVNQFKNKFKYNYSNEMISILNYSIGLIKEQLDYIIDLHGQFNSMLTTHKPEKIIIGYDITLEGRLLSLFAKESNITTFSIMHGSITGEPLDTMHVVDNLFLWGNAAKRDLIKKGVSPRILKVVGAPYLDNIKPKITNQLNPLIKNWLKLKDVKPYILIAHSGPGQSTSIVHYREFVKSVESLILKYTEFNWVVKLHRKDNGEFYEHWKNHKILSTAYIINHYKTPISFTIFDWLQGCQILITGNSTVAIEAMYMKVPVITTDFNNEYKGVDFIDNNATFHAFNTLELMVHFNNIINKKNTDTQKVKSSEYVKDYYFQNDGCNVSDYIISLMK